MHPHLKVFCLVLSLISLKPTTVFAWGDIGHRVVGQIAETYLDENAKKAVASLLKDETLAEASTWADEMRSHPNREYYDLFKPWHFLEIPPGVVYSESTRNGKGDILYGLQEVERRLKDLSLSKEKKVEALRLLVHFVGDIHQPFHVSDGTDRGANWCRVTWFEKDTNLHQVWDEEMIESLKLSFTELARFVHHPTSEEVTLWQSTDYRSWADESYQLRPGLYPNFENRGKYCKEDRENLIPVLDRPALSYRYRFDHMDLLKMRLLQGGVRLGGTLNRIFGS